MSRAVTLADTSNTAPELYENVHVHDVYNAIADHFSSTRYKPWPVVAAFLESIPVGSVGLDAGTGNGKYLISPAHLEGKYWTIGLDRSERLLDIARRAGNRDRECVLGDVLYSCWRDGAFVRLMKFRPNLLSLKSILRTMRSLSLPFITFQRQRGESDPFR